MGRKCPLTISFNFWKREKGISPQAPKRYPEICMNSNFRASDLTSAKEGLQCGKLVWFSKHGAAEFKLDD